ncbi:facilitative glucose transporter GT1 [Besnoitia besnoiti]|uniref:Hexose transporter 1 n=1 Tax=Besnoitia besnoiti TaxID=94643 RepID=A0A2A9MN92_BESBE|nr:facilitative glucose transporter GT1 [Besnoitia besnoiti]PFH37102.1 facilitative glucose transporter GT1 [Besnoitia besnoiti]
MARLDEDKMPMISPEDTVANDDALSFGMKGRWCVNTAAQLTSVAILGSFQLGFNLAALNTAKAFIALDFRWCLNERGLPHLDCATGRLYGSLVNAAAFVGALVGCIVAGRVTELGRCACLRWAHCLCVVACVLSAAALDFVTLFASRLFVGLALGLFTVCVPLYISEMSPADSRGFYVTFHQLLIAFGPVVGTALGLAFSRAPGGSDAYSPTQFEKLWWRVMLGFPAVISLLSALLLWFVYPFETPQILVERDQKSQAGALLREIYSRDTVGPELQSIIRRNHQKQSQDPSQLGMWRALVHPAYSKVIMFGCYLSIAQQLSGVNVLVADSNLLYSSLNLPPTLVTALTVALMAIGFVVTIATLPLVDHLGRRVLLLVSIALCLASMCTAFVVSMINENSGALRWIIVGCMYSFSVGFGLGYGPVFWIYLQEIFPPEIKQAAVSLASSLNWLAAVAMVQASDFLLQGGLTVLTGICTVSLGIVFVLTLFFARETKGLPVGESPYFTNPAIVHTPGDTLPTVGSLRERQEGAVDGIVAETAADAAASDTKASTGRP